MKDHMKKYETSLVRVPQIEAKLVIQYNKIPVNDHYQYIMSKSIEEYLEKVKGYSTQDISVNFKLHIPSL